MELLTAILLILAGFALLVFGGEFLVKSAVSIASRLKVEPAIIGLTIIAAGTSAPELVTSLMAAIKNSPDVAIGNVVGSNIFNILAILGISSIITINHVAKSMTRIEMPLLVVCTLMFIGMCWDFQLTRIEGVISLLILSTVFYISIYRSRRVGYEPDDDIEKLKNWGFDIGYLVIGCSALLYGAKLALDGGISLGQIAGLSERVIGITIISAGTGLPELATSAVAAYKGRHDIAIANVIGSNLMNTLGVIGVTASLKQLQVSEKIVTEDSLFLILVTVLIIPIVIFGKYRINRAVGFMLSLGYIGYVLYLLR